jgi:hypothetical protein
MLLYQVNIYTSQKRSSLPQIDASVQAIHTMSVARSQISWAQEQNNFQIRTNRTGPTYSEFWECWNKGGQRSMDALWRRGGTRGSRDSRFPVMFTMKPYVATVRKKAYALWEQDPSRSSAENWRLAEELLGAECSLVANYLSQCTDRHEAYIALLQEEIRLPLGERLIPH